MEVAKAAARDIAEAMAQKKADGHLGGFMEETPSYGLSHSLAQRSLCPVGTRVICVKVSLCKSLLCEKASLCVRA